MAIAGLIVGLGNPGQKYARTRHNLGFMVVDRIIDREPGCTRISSRCEKDFLLWQWAGCGGLPWLLLKPQTYMNRSGRALGQVLKYRDLDPKNILVVHDELDLPLGRIRFKNGGGLAGHNGLKSVAEVLGTRDFHRLRMGIDRPRSGEDVTSYVLGTFSGQESKDVDGVLELAVSGVLAYCREGIDHAMHMVHGR
ncbi:aminoacyl-tRNA hydrolase [Desulfoplanes sp.]